MQLEQLKTPSGEVMQGPLLITPQALGDDRVWFYLIKPRHISSAREPLP